jgi:hypothetical protein
MVSQHIMTPTVPPFLRTATTTTYSFPTTRRLFRRAPRLSISQSCTATIKRKKSDMSILGLSRSTSVAPPAGSRSPLAPHSDLRRAHGGLRHLFGIHRTRRAVGSDVLISSPRFLLARPPPPQISELAKAFVNSLNTRKLSDFMIWRLHHELIELPEGPEA